MAQDQNLCVNCMKELGEDFICPHCGFDNRGEQPLPFLAYRMVLSGRYLVGKALEHTADGVTYIGFDLNQRTPVMIREFLPKTISTRMAESDDIKVRVGSSDVFEECLQNFLELWRGLARMRELSALVPVYDIFEENQTAYAVSEYMDCITLREYLLRSPSGYMPWEKARVLFMPLLSSLNALHNAGILHRNISPNTLLVCKDGKLRLSGFSIWEATCVNEQLPAEPESGYAAIEQYTTQYQQGPWTDVYGFTASLYRALVGNTPIESTQRIQNDRLMVPAKLAEQIPAYVINALGNGLQIDPEDRTRNVEQLRGELSASPSAAVQSAAVPVPSQKPAVRPSGQNKNLDAQKKKQIAIIVGIAAVILAIAVGIGLFIAGKNKTQPPAVTTTQSNTNSGTSTTSSETVEVPNFIKYTDSSVQSNTVWMDHFQIQFDYQYNDKYDSGIVYQQSVPKGSKVNKGTAITLTVSKGVEQVVLPDCKGWQVAEAEAKLTQLGFKVRRTILENDGSQVEGLVYEMSQEAEKQYAKGSTIILQVWGAPKTTLPETSAGSGQAPTSDAPMPTE